MLSRFNTTTIIEEKSTGCSICLRETRSFKLYKCGVCFNDGVCKRCMVGNNCKKCCFNNYGCIECSVCHFPITYGHTYGHELCVECNASFCDKCGINKLCKNCFIKDEFELLLTELQNILKFECIYISKSSISIIVDYCIGYIVPCCNRRALCSNMILFNNKFDFLTCNKSYKYISSQNISCTIRMYGLNMRIFCIECTYNKISPCLNSIGGFCDKYDIVDDNEYNNICGNHYVCFNCNQRELFNDAIDCYDVINNVYSTKRRWIYYTAPSTKIYKCISCNKYFCIECMANKLHCKKCQISLSFINNLIISEYNQHNNDNNLNYYNGNCTK